MDKQFLHMQKLAGLITESEFKQKMNEEYNGTISFGPFKNVDWHQRSNNDIYLTVTDSDNFREIENNYDFQGEGDGLADEDKSFLDTKVNELADEMSNYLASIGIDNDIYDNQIGYGQEIDNLVVAFDKNDLSKLK
tara:strand:- start:1638 stop:2045 length:408 start_codon:yes stop_codon:yes gene_type:complete